MKFTSIKNSLTEMFRKPKPQFDWKFGGRSLQKLQGVDDRLVRVAHLALNYSSVDFGITCGLRSQAEQNQLRAEGKSQVKHSRHQDGCAIDIVCYVDGKVTWDFKHYMVVAQSIALAARELDVEIRWGAAWPYLLNHKDASAAHNDYVTIRKMQGRKPFIDGPHFEIPKE
jgi:peptidoglycan L-alanyl-D-glutamate endopeptidase CwlK